MGECCKFKDNAGTFVRLIDFVVEHSGNNGEWNVMEVLLFYKINTVLSKSNVLFSVLTFWRP